jgi:hypothetical protein
MTIERARPRAEREALADDLVWGVPAIAAEIRKTPRQTYYLIGKGTLPVKKLGARTYAALRSELRRRFQAEE